MGRRRIRILTGLEIPRRLQLMYRIPSAQEEGNATTRFTLPMDQDDPPKVMMLHLKEVQQFFIAYPDGSREYTDV